MADGDAETERVRDTIRQHAIDHFEREATWMAAWCREQKSQLARTALEPIFEWMTRELFDNYDDAVRYDGVHLKLDEPGWRFDHDHVRWLEDDFMREMRLIFALCESPIEQLLGAALLARVNDGYGGPLASFDAMRLRSETDGTRFTAQYRVLGYRTDFAFRTSYDGMEKFLVVECDGHDFHDRTKELASRDRARDRALLEAGIPVMRFTGADVWADAMGCVETINDQLHRHAEEMIERGTGRARRSRLDDLK